MRPRERRETEQNNLFKARLDQIVDRNHALPKLTGAIDWGFLENSFGAVYNDGPGQPPLPTRLMAGLAILKHMHNLKLPFDRSSMTRWPQRMGEEKLAALLHESLATATRAGAAKPSDFTKVIVDSRRRWLPHRC